MYIYLNGEIVEDSEARISPFDYGYLYGIGFFETLRIYHGHPFLLDDHLDRINKALQDLNIDYTFEKNDVLEIIHQLLERNQWKNASIRINLSAGEGEAALRTLHFTKPTVLIYGSSLPQAGVELQQKKARILSVKRSSPEGHERWKSHHFMNNLIAKQEINDPSTEGIFMTADGFVAEGITSNLFWVKEKIVHTPSLDTGILNGITRQYVMSLCEKLGIPVKEGRYTQKDLLNADECFLTNSVQEITAVRTIDDTSFPGDTGEVTTELFRYYQQDRERRWSRRP
ncbi:aminodeoxychorismate lyase [Pseudalkalibacillus sp. Hm43]|uniref:aminodeoxychorismate lyase n=1 Tax=Pseudalkalibacillus sp. Hm43 TaxID=3450742 RepID=UPI003F41FC4C